MENFSQEVKKRFDELVKMELELKDKIDKIRSEKKPLVAYLKEVGMIEKRPRAKRKKTEGQTV